MRFDDFSYFTVLECIEKGSITGTWSKSLKTLTDLEGEYTSACYENGVKVASNAARPIHFEDPAEELDFLDDGTLDVNFVNRFAIPAWHVEFTLDTDLN